MQSAHTLSGHGNNRVRELETVGMASQHHSHQSQCVPVGPQMRVLTQAPAGFAFPWDSRSHLPPSTSNSGAMLAGPGPSWHPFLSLPLSALQAHTKN